MQRALMCSAVATQQNIQIGWWKYALEPQSTRADVCSWRCVECESGILTSLTLKSMGSRSTFCATIEYLPQTIRFLHLICVNLERFSLRDLPRDLRYVAVSRAQVRNGLQPSMNDPRGNILNMADLPPFVEEVYFAFTLPSCRTVCIHELPQALRLLYVAVGMSVRYAVVDNGGLPAGLQLVKIYSSSRAKKAVLRSADSAPVDKRVRSLNLNSKESFAMRDLTYSAKHDAICRRIFTEVGAPVFI